MTIGPAPMMSTLLMSVRLGTPALLHHPCEAIEEISDVVRPGARFGMPLEAERRTVGASETLQAAVEERNMGGLEVRREGVRVDREAVVLAGDDHRPALQIFHRVVGAVMAELHLDGLRARGEPHELVAEADPEGRNPGVDDLADRAYGIVAGLRIARAGRQKHPVGLDRKGVRCRRRVSMPATAPTFSATRKSDSPRSARQLETATDRSRTTSPAANTFPDSTSSRLAPVLPMCGWVRVTIWRQYDGSVRISWYPVI